MRPAARERPLRSGAEPAHVAWVERGGAGAPRGRHLLAVLGPGAGGGRGAPRRPPAHASLAGHEPQSAWRAPAMRCRRRPRAPRARPIHEIRLGRGQAHWRPLAATPAPAIRCWPKRKGRKSSRDLNERHKKEGQGREKARLHVLVSLFIVSRRHLANLNYPLSIHGTF